MYRGVLRVIGLDKIRVARPRQMSGNGYFHLPTKTSESAINSPIDLKNWCMPDCENVDMIQYRSSLAHSTVRSARPCWLRWPRWRNGTPCESSELEVTTQSQILLLTTILGRN